ncbi:ATP-binding cassette domain-containing protein [Polynucleobacter necessarius]|uniref:ATP-binding cassette domain-containing protein n=1 Tax=Polynucleobacter necessarius TaxID=576610 RepID=UPI001E2E0120|nr:ATP-binding cassette domain-containing protein [Polynucleobacter necessarius]
MNTPATNPIPFSTPCAIDVHNLTVGYGSNVLMKDLNFTINNGEIFVILGGSGCGKSSLLKNLFGLYQPLSGDVLIEGKTSPRPKEQSVRIS